MTAAGAATGPCRHGVVDEICEECTRELAPAAVLVHGPESSGNHLAMEILQAMGCHGSTGDRQPFDNGVPPVIRGRPIMWGASLPRDRHWPDLEKRIGLVLEAGYTPHVLVVQRGLYPTSQSQQHRRRVPNALEAERNIAGGLARVYAAISRALCHQQATGFGYSILLYEELLDRPQAVLRWLADRIGLEYELGRLVRLVRDENAKHWQGRA